MSAAHDLRGTELWEAVEAHHRRMHEPVLGRPHRLLEPSVSPDGSILVFTAFVHDELEGVPRRGAFVLRDGDLVPLQTGSGSATPRMSPDGRARLMLSPRTERTDVADGPAASPTAAPGA